MNDAPTELEGPPNVAEHDMYAGDFLVVWSRVVIVDDPELVAGSFLLMVEVHTESP